MITKYLIADSKKPFPRTSIGTFVISRLPLPILFNREGICMFQWVSKDFNNVNFEIFEMFGSGKSLRTNTNLSSSLNFSHSLKKNSVFAS